MSLPGRNCLIHAVEAKFAKPVYVGDVLTVTGTVGEVHDSVEQAVVKVTITNQRGEKVLRGTLKVGMLHEELRGVAESDSGGGTSLARDGCMEDKADGARAESCAPASTKGGGAA